MADRVGADRRRPRPLHRRLRAGRGRRAGGARGGAGGLGARRRARATRPAGCSPSAAGGPSTRFRRRSALDERYAAARRATWRGRAPRAAPGRRRTTCSGTPTRIDDDVLALMFVACHPVLSREAQRRPDAAGGRRPDQRARSRAPSWCRSRPSRRGSPGRRRRWPPRRCRSRCRRPSERRERLGSVLQRPLPDLHRGLDRHRRRATWIRTDLAGEAMPAGPDAGRG